MAHPLTHDDPAHLGPYRLVARLGGGGMGTVYLGRSPRGRTLALKTMHRDIAQLADFRTRFQLEADAARVIGEHHGALVVDADPLAETPWLATEYVLGPPLDEAVSLCGPLPEATTRVLGSRLCQALSQLHSSDVVHRDLKPSNILLTATGPKVIDFGIARAAGDDRLTRTGAAAGTPAFMSPEQATGQEHSPAGDVFALAGVLVFSCTGHGPFGTGQTADLLYRVRYGEPDLTGVPQELARLLQRCLAKDPQSRPGAGQLAALLHDGDDAEFADHLPDAVHAEILRRSVAVWDVRPARSAPPPEEPAETHGRPSPAMTSRRRLLALAGGGLVAAAGAGGIWAWTRPSGSDEPPSASTPPPAAPASAPEPNWQFKSSDSGAPTPLLTERRVGVVVAGGKLTLLSAGGEVVGTEADVWSAAADEGRIHGLQGDACELAVLEEKTGRFAAPVADVRDLLGSDVTGPQVAKILAVHKGTVLVREEEGGLRRTCMALDAESGKKLWRGKISHEAVVVAKAGELLVLASASDGEVWAIDVETGKEAWSRKFSLGYGREIRTSGADTEGNLYLNLDEIIAVRAKDGKTRWRFGKGRAHKAESSDLAEYGAPVAHDGTVYALESGNGVVALDLASGKLRWELKLDVASRIPLDAVPVVGDRYVYFPSGGTSLVTAVDVKKRRAAWTSVGADKEAIPELAWHRETSQLVVATDKRVFGLPLK
ncbi:serine/threonine-protein kinase [Streptomyces tubbatahanensis]|uniref:Serine/threonine-protein kinase n=1 Tax=Streptomyces tubbatahanensis TaxID=2923272 RepID=A0ABY3XZH1_9ACTN|nr:PQQ-binding-like beta-propeller repeat protein [Streptomyces tubbatahanensis]UNS99892.1 serine/threonine-protein kinase [Streptomyces tubbatahanensis]